MSRFARARWGRRASIEAALGTAQVGHTDPKVTLGIYAKVMLRTDGERDL